MANASEQEPTPQGAPASPPASEPEEITEAEQEEAEPAGDAILGDGEEGEPVDEEIDFEEIDFEGKKYPVPAELKSAFLMQKDYTQKTQVVAEQAREVEAGRKAVIEHAKALETESEERATLANVNGYIAQYEKVNWRQYELDNPVDAQAHWRQFSLLKEQRQTINEKLATNARERSVTAQRDHATRVAKAVSELQRDVKGWGPDLALALTDYGVSQGYTRDDLTDITDSRHIKVLHKAHLYDQLIAKQKSAPRAATNPQATVKPLKQVSKGASRPAASAEPSDKDSDDEWLKKRNAQLRKKSA